MSAPKSAVSKVRAEMVDKIQELDLRRQTQIRNQVDVINRLMEGATYEGVMSQLVQALSETQVQLEAAILEIRDLRAEKPIGYELGNKT